MKKIKFTINTQEMKAIASKLSPIVKNGFTETARRILFNVDDKITAYAGNGESFIKIVFDCTIEGKGDFVVSGEKFINVVNSASSKEIEFSITDENKLLAVSNKISYQIALIETDGKCLIAPEDSNTKNFKIKAQDLCSAMSSLFCCISPEKSHLYCIMIHSDEKEKNKIYFVATDCTRLGVAERKATLKDVVPNLLIPEKAANFIKDITKDIGDNEITVNYTENTIQISTDNIFYTSKLLDGSFPKYQAVIPTNKKVLEVNTVDFKETLKKITAISSSEARVDLTINSNKIDIACKDSITGDNSTTSMDATFNNKTELKITFNYKMLSEILDKISSNIVRFQVEDGKTPVIIRSVDDESVKYIFMPVVERYS